MKVTGSAVMLCQAATKLVSPFRPHLASVPHRACRTHSAQWATAWQASGGRGRRW
jgi:hypothetical protein